MLYWYAHFFLQSFSADVAENANSYSKQFNSLSQVAAQRMQCVG